MRLIILMPSSKKFPEFNLMGFYILCVFCICMFSFHLRRFSLYSSSHGRKTKQIETDQKCEELFVYDFLAIVWHLVQNVHLPVSRRQLR